MLIHKLFPKERIHIDGQVTIIKLAGENRSYGFIGKGKVRFTGKGGLDKSFDINDEPLEEKEEWETSPMIVQRLLLDKL